MSDEVLPSHPEPSPAERQAAWDRIKRILDRAAENAREVADEEAEAAIDEAMSHVRPR